MVLLVVLVGFLYSKFVVVFFFCIIKIDGLLVEILGVDWYRFKLLFRM